MRFIAFFATFTLTSFLIPLPVEGVQSSGSPASTSSWNIAAITPWDYVGSIGQASGVYLGNYDGNYWVATAAHVGLGAFNLGGYNYSSVGGSLVTFSPTGAATYQPDLVLFRINATTQNGQTYLDSLQRMALTATELTAGTDVRLIGHGDGNDSAVIKAWGDNEISGTLNFTIGSNGSYGGNGYYTLNLNGVAAITGDSGGGMFHLIDEAHWALAGIIVANGNVNGEGPGTAIIGLQAYADQILSVIPEPATLAATSALLALASAVVARRQA